MSEELSLENLGETVKTVAALWERPETEAIRRAMRRSPAQRDLSDALDQLAAFVKEATGADGPPPLRMPTGPDEFARPQALERAIAVWQAMPRATVASADEHARAVTTLAAAFTRFMTDGTVHEIPDAPRQADAAESHRYREVQEARPDGVKLSVIAEVVDAAKSWADRVHFMNPAGLENWRNWADEHDIKLLNAILAYEGLPPLEPKKP